MKQIRIKMYDQAGIKIADMTGDDREKLEVCFKKVFDKIF